MFSTFGKASGREEYIFACIHHEVTLSTVPTVVQPDNSL